MMIFLHHIGYRLSVSRNKQERLSFFALRTINVSRISIFSRLQHVKEVQRIRNYNCENWMNKFFIKLIQIESKRIFPPNSWLIVYLLLIIMSTWRVALENSLGSKTLILFKNRGWGGIEKNNNKNTEFFKACEFWIVILLLLRLLMDFREIFYDFKNIKLHWDTFFYGFVELMILKLAEENLFFLKKVIS